MTVEQTKREKNLANLAIGRAKRHPYITDFEYMERLKSRSVITAAGCWELQGFVRRSKGMENAEKGYVDFCYRNKTWRGHRVAYLLSRGIIPTGMVVAHKCDNPPCCNPDHLYLATHQQNMDDMNDKGRNGYSKKTHCPQGHPFDEQNTRHIRTPRRSGKGRQCKACCRVRLRIRSGWPKEEAEAMALIAIPSNVRTKRRQFDTGKKKKEQTNVQV